MAAARELPGDFIIRESQQNQEDRFNNLACSLLPPSVLYNKKKTLLKDVNLPSSIIMRVWEKILPTTNNLLSLEYQVLYCTIKHIAIITNVKYICIYDVCVCSFAAVPSPLPFLPSSTTVPPDEPGPFQGFFLKGVFLCHRCWNRSL